MQSAGYAVVGVDFSGQMQRVTQKKARRKNQPVKQVQAAAQALPFHDGVFDHVVSTFPAGYILDATTLQSVYAVLKPGGSLIILGISVLIKPRLFRFLFNWIYDEFPPGFVETYFRIANNVGFECSVKKIEERHVVLPVMILQKEGSIA